MAARDLLLQSVLGELDGGAFGARVADSARHALTTLCALGPAVFERDHYEPGHFTASAFIVDEARTQLLLIRHRKLGMWLQPGGHVEPGDVDLLEAARREVEEETGLVRVELVERWFDIDVHRIPAWGSAPSHLHHDVRVLLQADGAEARVGEDVDDLGWFDLETVASSTGVLRDGLGTDDSVRRVARRLLLG